MVPQYSQQLRIDTVVAELEERLAKHGPDVLKAAIAEFLMRHGHMATAVSAIVRGSRRKKAS